MIKAPTIGERNKNIILQSTTGQIADGYGGLTEGSLITKRTFWVEAEQLKGFKSFDNQNQVLTNVWRFKGIKRELVDASNTDRLLYSGKEMSILSIVNDDLFTEITAQWQAA